MITVDEAKAMARRLRPALEARGHAASHSECLELVGTQLGHRDWNTACAVLDHDNATSDPLSHDEVLQKMQDIQTRMAPRFEEGTQGDPLPHEQFLQELKEIRTKMTTYFEQAPHPHAAQTLSRLDQKIAETEKILAAGLRTSQA